MVFGSIADIFFQWEYIGVFDFILPFLLVFVIIYGILTSTNFFGKNKSVYIVIAIVIALMSLRFQAFFSDFLSELFPRLGVGLAIILSILILVGVFISDKDHYWRFIMMAIGAVIAIIIIWQSANALGWSWAGSFGSDTVGFVILGVLIIGVIIAVVLPKTENKPTELHVWPRFPDN